MLRNADGELPFTDAALAQAFAALDGRGRSEVSVVSDDGDILAVGGGPDGFVVQHLLAEDEGGWILIGDADAVGEIELVISGQLSPFPACWIVDRATAHRAARHFAFRADRDPALAWERDF